MSDDPRHDDRLFELLAQVPDPVEVARAPSRLKAKLYSALVRREQASGPLRSLGETRSGGYGLCVFEDFWRRAAPGEEAQSYNCCKLCHARLLAERLEGAPIHWGNCPYAAFGEK